jgi:hypothetical protein
LSDEFGSFRETNKVLSFVCYDWKEEVDIVFAYDMQEEMAKFFSKEPGLVTVCADGKCKDYTYRNFHRLKIIDRKSWSEIGYLWERRKNYRSEFSINIRFELSPRCLAVHFDERAVGNSRGTWDKIVNFVSERIRPTYAIGYALLYYEGPASFAQGLASSRYATVDRTFYGTPDILRKRSFEFVRTFLNRDRLELNNKIRDVFVFNLLSRSHLDRPVQGTTLEKWIIANSAGELKPHMDDTWIWQVPPADIEKIRRPLIQAGVTVVTQ